MPGSFASSLARSSIADTCGATRGAVARRSERELEREVQPEPAGELAHLLARELLGLALRLGHGNEDEILEHLHVGCVDDGGVDLHATRGARAIDVHAHHAAAGSTGHDAVL